MVLALVALLCQWCAACQPDHSPFLPLFSMQINADSCVFIDKCTGVTIKNLKITQTKPRDPKRPKSLGDGHWGVHSGEACGDGMWLRAGPGGHAACVAGIAPQALRWQGNRCQEASSHHPPASRHSPVLQEAPLMCLWMDGSVTKGCCTLWARTPCRCSPSLPTVSSGSAGVGWGAAAHITAAMYMGCSASDFLSNT